MISSTSSKERTKEGAKRNLKTLTASRTTRHFSARMSSSFKKLNGYNVFSQAPSPPAESDDVSEDVDSVFEKKCRLINRQLDAFGMGKYQWSIWVLCGFGYLIDLLWAQAFGLVLSPIEQELGFPGRVLCSDLLQMYVVNYCSQSIWQY